MHNENGTHRCLSDGDFEDFYRSDCNCSWHLACVPRIMLGFGSRMQISAPNSIAEKNETDRDEVQIRGDPSYSHAARTLYKVPLE